ncbi:Bax inhibitor-1/YccA family protein [Phenylobacterium aquaticum]|uniref:Bax inhibitor-1/YccA family protein n=1 Tax=Phenylobacterium aquaticum TaxID=1763816 RepID=UPI001F5D36F7|nr:Bax inhibitor-1/YccA family protein [Phenylobacterium aquaticum]MCI3132792.1 Bax inhibitor-1/YccA family protein [Phenylobacterium aquaticum]
MTHLDQDSLNRVAPTRLDMSLDVGLRRFMIGVYNKVALGLVLSAALAYLTSMVPPIRDAMFRLTPDGRFAGYTLIGMVVAFAPLVVLMGSMFAMRKPSARGAGLLFWSISALIGASLGVLGLVYTGASLATTFLITAAAFGGLSLFGYTTKKDLTGFGSFLLVGLVGLIVASLVQMVWNPPGFSFVISALGVLIFAGLIAHDTQRLELTYHELGGDTAALGAASSYGALSLYLDFINLFQFLLNLFGQRR